MAFYPAQLQSANPEQFGIVYADEVQGHKTVADLDALYDISDAILSKSTTNSGNDAIGQQWYVISEECYYRLDNWANRNQASGWRKMQNVDEEFDSLQSHGADKIESFTTTDSTVLLNYNTWKNSTSNVDGSVTIPAATGDQAGVLTANGKDQLTQLNKIAEVTHLTDDGVFTEEASTVTIHYSCINTREGATSSVVTKSEAIPAATLTNAGVLDAAHRNQLEQLDKLGEVTHLTDNGVFTTDANTVTLHYQCIDTDAGANSAVSTKTAVIPEATLTNAGTLASSNRNQLEQLNKIEKTSFLHHTSDNSSATFTSTGSAVTLHWNTVDTTDGANSEVTERNANIPVASSTSAGTMSSTDKIEHDRISTVNFELGAVTPSSTTVQIAASKTNITNGSSVANNITIPGVTETTAGVMSSADKAKLNDIQFVQSLTTTGTQTVSVTSDTVVINSTSQLNVIGINANAYNKVRFVNATSINVLFTFNNSSAGNNKLLTTYYPSQITIPQYCSVEFVKSSTGWILSDLTGVTYFPDVDTDETKIVTVNSDRSIGTLPIRVMKEWDETVTEELQVSKLNQRFPDAPVGFQFVCVSINRIYEKFNETNEWVCHFIWENEASGTATTSEKGLMSAADKLKLDNTIPNYTVNGLKISTNPVLDGADVKITGYSQPGSSSALTSSDTINAALGKLERGLNNEISNRTTAVNKLRDEINNNINTKLDELEQQINENIDTRLTEVEGEINNTITPQINNINTTISNLDIFSDFKTDSGTASATTNNDSITISGGTNISTSGSGKTVTINLDSTISLTRVNASSGFYQQSDERLKSNIKPLEHTLEDICSIPTDSFILNGKQDLGTIAQDVEKIIPEVVCECEVKAAEIPNPENFTKVEKDGETYVLVKEVDYAKLSILALEGVKLLKAEIDKLKEELALRENK